MRKALGRLVIYTLVCTIILCTGRYSLNSNKAADQEKEYEDINKTEITNYDAEQEVKSTGTSLISLSAKEVPAVKDIDSTYSIISSLNYEDSWLLGRFDQTKRAIISDDTYLSLNCYLPIESTSYKISINNTSYRMIVNEFSGTNKNIGYVDLCNGDILNISDSVKYITISIYKYKNRQIVEHSNKNILNDLKNGLAFSVAKINNLAENSPGMELLTSEVHMESLSNFYNFRKGWLKSWGGVYEFREESLCTRNFYKVDDKSYIYNVNDSRVSLSISEYDAKGKWVNYIGGLKNGDKFTKQRTTAYIGLTIKSLKWGVNLYTLFENGLRIDLASTQYLDKISTINYSSADFSSTDHWKAGAYLFETGKYIIDNNKICYDSFLKIDNKEYVVSLTNSNLKMNILELDRNGKVIINKELLNGEKWKKSEGTDIIGITIYGNDKTLIFADYKNLVAKYLNFGLKEYTRYAHNTKMKDITAGEFVNLINVGWNLGNSLDSYSKTSSRSINLNQEIYWGNPYITKDLIDYAAKCGFNTIRIPVTWYYNTYKDERGNLLINKDWLNRVQDVVDYAIANGLYVIINTHHEQPILYAGTDEATMQQVLKNAEAIWTQIAEHFKTYDEHLIFESYNEIDNVERYWNYSDKAAVQMNELNQIFVNAVRSTGNNNSKRILVVPTLLDGANSRFYNAFRMPKDTVADKIAVELHTYSKKFNQDIECDFAEMEEFSHSINAPIIIGEFGTTTAYPLPALRAEQASNFIARAAEHGIKCIWWDNGSEYKIINRLDFSSSDKNMIKALLEGSEGAGYLLEQEILLNSSKQFAYYMPDIATGELKFTYWGTMTADVVGSGIKVQEGSICSVSLKAVNEASGIWIQRLLFYDANGALVQRGKEIQSKYYICTVPDNAVTMRVSMNNPNINISLDKYVKYLDNKDIEIGICFFNFNDLKKTKLTITPFN